MHRIVDAMNVIGSRPDGWWRDRPAAIARLLERLDERAAAGEERAGAGGGAASGEGAAGAGRREGDVERRAGSGERLTVMLERRPADPPPLRWIEVAWAPGGGRDAADDEIVRRLPEWLTADPEVVVVTSDRELARRARELGAAVEPAAPFRRALDRQPGR